MTTPQSSQASQTSPVDQHVDSLLFRVGEVPAVLHDKAVSFVANKYQQLSERYGSTGAKAVLAAMVLLTPVPLPGTSLLPIALAEGVKRVSGLVAEGGKQMGEAAETLGSGIRSGLELLARQIGVSLEELEKESRELLQEALGMDQPAGV